MCVATPGQIESIHDGDSGRRAQVHFAGGSRRVVELAMVPEAVVGDYVIVHSGFGIRVISAVQATETLAILNGIRQ
jgi:hydrogenase expression/formation protein HypC